MQGRGGRREEGATPGGWTRGREDQREERTATGGSEGCSRVVCFGDSGVIGCVGEGDREGIFGHLDTFNEMHAI